MDDYFDEDKKEEIRTAAIEHIARRSFKNACDRLDRKAEYHGLSDSEKREMAFDSIRKALDESYGESLRIELVHVSRLKELLLEDDEDALADETINEDTETDEDIDDEE